MDRENVYKELHKAWKTLDEYSVNGTPFDMQIVLDQIFDALALLKEQEAQIQQLKRDLKDAEDNPGCFGL